MRKGPSPRQIEELVENWKYIAARDATIHFRFSVTVACYVDPEEETNEATNEVTKRLGDIFVQRAVYFQR